MYAPTEKAIRTNILSNSNVHKKNNVILRTCLFNKTLMCLLLKQDIRLGKMQGEVNSTVPDQSDIN